MSKKTKTELPSLLAFERKFEPSDGLMYSGKWSDISELESKLEKDEKPKWKKIPISKRYNRATQSSEGIADSKKPEPNPVSSGNDDANLFSGNDTLKLSFTMRVIGNLGKPFACNSPNFENKIIEKVNRFKKDEKGLQNLAFRYAYNIVNGRFLWRNRVCAEKVMLHVYINKEDKPLTFNAYDFSLKDFDKNSENDNLKTLSQYISKGLNSEDDFVFLKVNAYAQLGEQQHVYPSEEMNTDVKGKTLFQIDNCAAMHNVKIGNAIRTLDNWYGDEDGIIKDGKNIKPISISNINKTPIAIEPFGAVTQRGIAYRPSKNDLYTQMKAWVNEDPDSDKDTLSQDEKSYVVANLIRGGVFSKGS